MSLSSDKQQALKQATIEYLQTLTLIHVCDQPKAHIGIDYQQHCFMYTFTSSEKDGPHGLFAPMAEWENYLLKIGEQTDGFVNHKTVSKCIDKALEPYKVIPLELSQCETATTQIIDCFNRHYYYRTTSYVPLSNIEVSSDVEQLELANATLYRGFSDSELSEHIRNLPDLPDSLVFNVPEQTCFLKFDTIGDDESIERQILEKTQQSLSVLRFCSWTNSTIKGTRRRFYNQARDVDYFPYHAPAGYYLYTNGDGYPFNRYLVNYNSPTSLKIDVEQVETFDLMGRELLNIHFANTGNPISEHILLALEWYDNGLHANTNRDSVYRFLVCLNAIVGWDYNNSLESPEMASRLKTLFNTTASHDSGVYHFKLYGKFEGLKDLSNWNADGKLPENIIDKVLGTYADLFNNLYQDQRNSILHGKPHKLGKPVSSQDVKNSQLLAQNALRLVMKLIADNSSWTTRDDVEKWFIEARKIKKP